MLVREGDTVAVDGLGKILCRHKLRERLQDDKLIDGHGSNIQHEIYVRLLCLRPESEYHAEEAAEVHPDEFWKRVLQVVDDVIFLPAVLRFRAFLAVFLPLIAE